MIGDAFWLRQHGRYAIGSLRTLERLFEHSPRPCRRGSVHRGALRREQVALQLVTRRPHGCTTGGMGCGLGLGFSGGSASWDIRG